MSNYGVKDIQTLSFRDAVRSKIGMYLSADREEAIMLGIRELIYNSNDEYEMGFGDTIKVSVNLDTNTIQVSDNARGIPCGKREDGTNSLTAACTMSHTGGKHEEGVYSGAVGINGIGLKVVCLTASQFKVQVEREGKCFSQSFEEGIPTSDVCEVKSQDGKTGTTILYIPSKEVYGDAKINIRKLEEELEELSYFSKGLKFILSVNLKGKIQEKIFVSKNGLADALNKRERFHTNILAYNEILDGVKVEFALQWTDDHPEIRPFANNLWVRDGGAFMTGFKTSLTKAFNNAAGTELSGDVIRKYLDGFVSVKVKVPQFSNQAKTALANAEARTSCAKAITEAMNIFAKKYSDDFNIIVERLLKEVKAENAAEKARNAILETQAKIRNSKKDKIKVPGKLKDCEIHDEHSMLFVVEGDSAAGSITTARDPRHVAVLPLRGKVINALKHDEEEVLKNDVILDLLKALGCGILDKYNTNDLNYGKICIYTDADVDGASIMCLLLTFFYRYMPNLLKEGKVYWARAPLYIIKKSDRAIGYAYNEEERDVLTKGKTGLEVKRCKGIGEMDSKDVYNTILSKDNAHFDRFTMDNYDKAIKMFTVLMGEAVEERKKFIFDNVDFDMLEE